MADLSEILEGSTPDGVAIEKPAPEVQSEAPATEAAAEPQDDGKRGRKRFQQEERDAREAGAGRVRDPATGQYVAKPKVEEPAAEPAVEPAAEPAKVAEPAAQQPAKQPETQQFTEKERAFLAAAQEERRKRQALEQQLATLQKQPEGEKKTFWDSPDEALQSFQQQVQQAILQTRLNTAEAIAKNKYKDFAENVAEFEQVAQSVPGLAQQMMNAADPAEFAYQVGKRQKELKQIGDIEEYKMKIQRETRAQLEAEFKAKEAERAALAANLTPSLSDTRGSGQTTRPVFTGPTPLDSILGR